MTSVLVLYIGFALNNMSTFSFSFLQNRGYMSSINMGYKMIVYSFKSNTNFTKSYTKSLDGRGVRKAFPPLDPLALAVKLKGGENVRKCHNTMMSNNRSQVVFYGR